jgi:predicted Zn-dependent peptidase
LTKAFTAGIILLCAAAAASGATPARAEAEASGSVTQSRLGNGLRIILERDPTVPTVAVCSVYPLIFSSTGELGYAIARVTARMLAQGREPYAPGRIVRTRGGETWSDMLGDRVRFCSTLPSGELDLALWAEATRWRDFALTQDNLDRQRAELQAEYTVDVTATAYARGKIRLEQLVFQANQWYQPGTFELPNELDRVTLDQVRRFHGLNFKLESAVLSMVGNFNPSAALELVRHRFGSSLSAASSRTEPIEVLDPQTTERFAVLDDVNASTPAIYMGWRIPPRVTREHRALELASFALGIGEGSLLQQSLAHKQPLVQRASAWTGANSGSNLFAIEVITSPSTTIERAVTELDKFLDRFRYSGPSEAELARAKQELCVRLLSSLEATGHRASWLADRELSNQPARPPASACDDYQDIGTADVRKAALQYLLATRRTVVEVTPPEQHAPTRAPPEYYLVSEGDTLSAIAKKHDMLLEELARANRIDPKKPLFPGQKLLVRRKRALRVHVVKRSETLGSIAKHYGVSVQALAAANGLVVTRALSQGQKLTLPAPQRASDQSNRRPLPAVRNAP